MNWITLIILTALVGCHSNPTEEPTDNKEEVQDKHQAYRNGATDARKINAIYKDEDLSNQIFSAMKNSNDFEDGNVRVVAFKHIILLLGQVPTTEQRTKAHSIAGHYGGKRRIVNRITIEGPISSLSHTSDTWITTKVKAQLISGYAFKAGQFKVTTENGIVYLLGNVSAQESALATKIARDTKGVRKVVTLFEHK